MARPIHFASGRASKTQQARVLAVLIDLDGARASRRQVQDRAFGDGYGATQTSTALHSLRAEGHAAFEGYGRSRFWFVTDAGRAHHVAMVANSAPFKGAS